VKVGSLCVVGKDVLRWEWLLGLDGWCIGSGSGGLVLGGEFRKRWQVWVRSVVSRFANCGNVGLCFYAFEVGCGAV
jgi:hypothetical protein